MPTRLAIGGFLALAVALGIGRFAYTPIIPAMAAGLGLTASQAGLIASANLFGYLAGALAASTRILRGPRWGWMMGALAVVTASTAAMGAASSMPAFLGLRLVGGVASAFALVLASTLVLDRLVASGRPGLSSLHFAGVGAGIALSGGGVAAMEALGAGWRSLWLVMGGLALLASAGTAFLVPPDHRHGSAPATQPAAAGLGSGFAAVAAAYGLFGFGYVITATFLVTIVRANPAMRTVEPLVWLVVGLAAAPSVALWAALARRWGIAPAYAAACIAEAAGVLASVLWPTQAGAMLAAVLLGGTVMGITALGLLAARQLAGGDPRQALALATAAFGAGQIAGPALAGILHDRTGSYLVPSMLGAAALLAGAATMATAHRALAPAANPPI